MKLNYLSIYIFSTAIILAGCKKSIDVNLDEGTIPIAAHDFTDPTLPRIFYNFKF